MISLTRSLSISSAIILAFTQLQAGLINGPMLGHVDLREATVWVQTDEPSIIRISYTEDGANTPLWTLPIETDPQLANTATLNLQQVEPGKHYQYQVEINGELSNETASFTSPSFYHGRTPPPNIRIAVGGAHYVTEEGFEPPYQTLGGGYGLFTKIAESKPDLMLWLGNTAHLRQSDWSSKSGILKRFTHARSVPELAPLLANVPNYAVWGSSDYSFNNAGRHYTYRQHTEDSFRAFWPAPAEVEALEGIATRFRRADVDFFVLDVRSYRNDSPDSSSIPQILGEAQIEWLRQEIIRSTATFKCIIAGSPILNPADNKENLSYADTEHTALLQMLRDERISGLFFLSGGKYYGELTRLVHANSYNLYDLTVGPLTAKPGDNSNELNFFRMPGSSTFERQFALIDVTGPEDARKLTLTTISMEGKELWKREINQSQLQPADESDQ
ncbi:MAG: alkaline phosphatase D family protein [Opitutaceae bacterium]